MEDHSKPRHKHMMEILNSIFEDKDKWKEIVTIHEVYMHPRQVGLEPVNGMLGIYEIKGGKRNDGSLNGDFIRSSVLLNVYLIWVPYRVLVQLDKGKVLHVKVDGTLVSHDQFRIRTVHSPKSQDYISADPIGSPRKERPKKTVFTRYCIALKLSEIYSITRSHSSYGWPYLNLVDQMTKEQYDPLYFHDGNISKFFDFFEKYVNLKKSKNEGEFLVLDKSTSLRQSLIEQEFDDLVDVMYPPAESGWNGWFDVQKFTQEVKNQMKLFGGKKEQDNTTNPSNIFHDKIMISLEDEEELLSSAEKEFEIVQPRLKKKKEIMQFEMDNPLTKDDWLKALDSDGKVKNPEEIRQKIFYQGIGDDVRKAIWPFLTGFFPWDSTTLSRNELLNEKSKEYEVYKNQWSSITESQRKRFSLFNEIEHGIDKDVVRTDREHELFRSDDSRSLKVMKNILLSYAFYNFDINYCQGMGDYLSPIVEVMQDEIMSFWTYASLMDNRIIENFRKDQKGIQGQLDNLVNIIATLDYELYRYLDRADSLNMYYCFRWVLVQFKREFSFPTIKRIWEAIWTNQCGPEFQLFIVFAILKIHRTEIICNKMRFDEILRFCCELRHKLDATQVIQLAIRSYYLYLDKKRLVSEFDLVVV